MHVSSVEHRAQDRVNHVGFLKKKQMDMLDKKKKKKKSAESERGSQYLRREADVLQSLQHFLVPGGLFYNNNNKQIKKTHTHTHTQISCKTRAFELNHISFEATHIPE